MLQFTQTSLTVFHHHLWRDRRFDASQDLAGLLCAGPARPAARAIPHHRLCAARLDGRDVSAPRCGTGVEQFGRIPFDAAAWDKFAANLHYHRSEFDQADGYPRLGELLDRLGLTGRRQSPVLSGHAAGSLSRHRAASRRSRFESQRPRLDAHHHRKAVRARSAIGAWR